MTTPKDKARERYATDPLYRARKLAAGRRSYAARAELIRYEKRVRYWASEEEREKQKAAVKKAQAKPEAKARARELRDRRRWKQYERERSRAEWRHIERLAALAIRQLERPTYKIIGPHGRRELEIWPPDDEAARWLAAAEDTSVQNPLDTARARQ